MTLTRRALHGALGAITMARFAQAAPEAGDALRIVVTGGHPGDPEYGCGGTVVRYTERGHSVTLLYLNRGQSVKDGGPGCQEDDASQGSVVRTREAADAARILGAQTAYADQCNGRAVVDPAHYDQFTALVRSLRPDVIFNQWPIDSHPDHRAISSLTLEAWSRIDRRPALYFYEVSNGEDTAMFAPTDYVDISAAEPRMREACYAHASQAPDHFYSLQSQVTRFRGIEAGYAHAEGFVRHVRSRQGLLP